METIHNAILVIQRQNKPVTIGTSGGFVIRGTVTEISENIVKIAGIPLPGGSNERPVRGPDWAQRMLDASNYGWVMEIAVAQITWVTSG